MIINVTSDKCYQNNDKKFWFKKMTKWVVMTLIHLVKGVLELISDI